MSFIKRKERHSLSLEKRFKAFPLPFKVNKSFSAAVRHGLAFSTTLASFTATPPVALPSLPCAACQTGLLVSPLCFCVYGQSPASTTLASCPATPPIGLPSLPCAACQTDILVSPLCFCVCGQSPASTTLRVMDLQALHSHEST